MSKLASECAMVGLMRVGYGFSTGQQDNKSIDYYCNKVQVFTTWLLLGTVSVQECKINRPRRMFSEVQHVTLSSSVLQHLRHVSTVIIHATTRCQRSSGRLLGCLQLLAWPVRVW